MLVTSAAFLIAISLVVFGIAYYYLTTRNRERMAIIEKGLPPDYFKGSGHYLPLILTLGIVCIGIALGIVVALWLISLRVSAYEKLILPISVFLFMGLSLVASYFVLKSIRDKKG
ncbi:DUF6249 domain-containing protein [Flavihumibacter solisilvae]|uniref:DUF6249 domain-containing protein n=1 Tax=Flavihumibacter solisilvae TaxID=1349421 RepID=UPI0006905AF1|nr:DUF6249 domain-containing protein [Flavihumibacter solisilvae]